MANQLTWQQDFLACLKDFGIDYALRVEAGIHLVVTPFAVIKLLDIGTKQICVTSNQHNNTLQTINLWEDVWLNRQAQVLSRMVSLAGFNQKIHARKTQLMVINQKQADEFLNQNHLQETAKAKYKLALTYANEMVAVATFNMRPMNIRLGYQSAELIRFATKNKVSVVGGLSKLLTYFIKTYQPNDVMSYVDNDWSVGDSYLKLGFEYVAKTDTTTLWVDMATNKRYFPHRIPDLIEKQFHVQQAFNFENFLQHNNFQPVFNTGSNKYILYLNA